MYFLKSVLFGFEGSYNIFGIQAKFENKIPSHSSSASSKKANLIPKIVSKCLNSNVFCCVTQTYAHVFIHEMSHALAYKLFTYQNSTIKIKIPLRGSTVPPREALNLAGWKRTIIHAAGPIGGVAFSSCKLVAATALKKYISWPIALVLGTGGVIGISGELLSAYSSVSNKEAGDFGYIARCSNTHLALASIVLISECALGIFAAIRI